MESEKLAEWLLIGFKRGWLMHQVLTAAGLFDQDMTELHERHPFMPPDAYSLKRPVRAFFAVEWPKLNAFLCKHEGDAQKLLSVVPQLVKLKSTGKRGEIRSARDVADISSARRQDRAVSRSYGLSRAAFKTHGADWNVCK